jgi:hypothetical protein
MNLSWIFIERPVATAVLTAALCFFGWFAFRTLPVNDLPNVDFPTLSVSANLPGADPETMASAVATPLERVRPLYNVQLMQRLENHIDRFFSKIDPSVFGSEPRPADSIQCWPLALSISLLSNTSVV